MGRSTVSAAATSAHSVLAAAADEEQSGRGGKAAGEVFEVFGGHAESELGHGSRAWLGRLGRRRGGRVPGSARKGKLLVSAPPILRLGGVGGVGGVVVGGRGREGAEGGREGREGGPSKNGIFRFIDNSIMVEGFPSLS